MNYPTLPIGFQTGHPLEGPGLGHKTRCKCYIEAPLLSAPLRHGRDRGWRVVWDSDRSQAGKTTWVECFSGKGAGTGGVSYATAEEAANAITMLNGRPDRGQGGGDWKDGDEVSL